MSLFLASVRRPHTLALVTALALTALAGCSSKPHAKHPATTDDDLLGSAQAQTSDFPAGAFSSPAELAAVSAKSETPRPGTCTTTCSIPTSSPATRASSRLAAVGLEPAMTTIHTCLSRIGANDVEPVIWARYAADGTLEDATIDLGGIDASRCATLGRADLPKQTKDVGGGMLICRQRCQPDAPDTRRAER